MELSNVLMIYWGLTNFTIWDFTCCGRPRRKLRRTNLHSWFFHVTCKWSGSFQCWDAHYRLLPSVTVLHVGCKISQPELSHRRWGREDRGCKGHGGRQEEIWFFPYVLYHFAVFPYLPIPLASWPTHVYLPIPLASRSTHVCISNGQRSSQTFCYYCTMLIKIKS
jgi:hypothetical protein